MTDHYDDDIDFGGDTDVDASPSSSGRTRMVSLPRIDRIEPDELVTKLSSSKLESVEVPLMLKDQVVLLTLGVVSQVGQRTVTRGEDVKDIRTATIDVEDGLLLDDTVMAALPDKPTVKHLWAMCAAAAARERDRREGNMPGDITDYLPEHIKEELAGRTRG